MEFSSNEGAPIYVGAVVLSAGGAIESGPGQATVSSVGISSAISPPTGISYSPDVLNEAEVNRILAAVDQSTDRPVEFLPDTIYTIFRCAI
jgi:hypothetical protein